MAQVNAQMRPLFSKLPDGFHIGLNISVSHINAPTFIDDCLHYQRGFEGKAVKLMLEITEQEPLLLNGAVVDKLNTLHSRGFSIALDDFGTGYSGLSCLHELIFDYIKIDQSFVGRVTGEAPASKLLDCVIEMARTLSLRIIAEGVETEAQRDYLNRQNIHLLQGYYFWKPMPYVALVMLLLSKTEGADYRRISGRCEKSCHATGYVSVSAVGMKTSSVAVRVMHDRPDKTRRGYLSVTPSLYGGSAEIRTLEPFRVAGFQDRCLQPLGHTSGVRRTINTSADAVKHHFDQLP